MVLPAAELRHDVALGEEVKLLDTHVAGEAGFAGEVGEGGGGDVEAGVVLDEELRDFGGGEFGYDARFEGMCEYPRNRVVAVYVGLGGGEEREGR